MCTSYYEGVGPEVTVLFPLVKNGTFLVLNKVSVKLLFNAIKTDCAVWTRRKRPRLIRIIPEYRETWAETGDPGPAGRWTGAAGGAASPAWDMKRRLLLVSNSTLHGSGYLEHCQSNIRDFFGKSVHARPAVSFRIPFTICPSSCWRNNQLLYMTLSTCWKSSAPGSV